MAPPIATLEELLELMETEGYAYIPTTRQFFPQKTRSSEGTPLSIRQALAMLDPDRYGQAHDATVDLPGPDWPSWA
jgi:hypothetical protein